MEIDYSGKEVVDVDMCRWATLVGEGVLATEGIGPCIGISVYDPAAKEGHLGHFPDIDNDFDGFIDAVRSTYVSRESIRVWVGGVSEYPSDEEITVSAQEVRSRVLEIVADMLGDCKLEVNWIEDKSEVIDYALDVSNGDEEVSVT